MHYYDNPKGMIPTWLINWGAKVGQTCILFVHISYCTLGMQYGVPQFLQTMQDACKGYPQYIQEQGRTLIPSPEPAIIA